LIDRINVNGGDYVEESMIQVEHVSKSFRKKDYTQQVLEDISIHVKAGEVVTLLGESGCGKSTLLNMVGGFVFPDKGKVLLDDELVRNRQNDCIILFQQSNLFPWKNVLDNVELGLRGDKKIKRTLAEEALSFVGLGKQIESYPHELSGGMKQRVAIARAFAMKPDVILMDEPFAALDTFNRYHLQDELIRLQKQEDISILLVTHDIDEAVYLSDRIYIMSANPGRIFEEMYIDLPKPRNRSHQNYHYYRARLMEQFKLSGLERKPEYYI